MKKTFLTCAFVFSWLLAKSQIGLSVLPKASPNKKDTTQMFYTYFKIYYYVPSNRPINDFQKSRLGSKQAKSGIFGGEMEMLWYVPTNRETMFEPHAFVRLEAYPTHYLSSRLGFGVHCRPLNASLGYFRGEYYRQVGSEGNFTTRRRREFDNYPLSGVYLQASDKDASFFFSVTFEKRRAFLGTRLASRIGQTLEFGDKMSKLRTLEIVLSSDKFSGVGTGISVEVAPQTRLEVLWISPDQWDRNQQARLGNKLTSGLLISLGCYVN